MPRTEAQWKKTKKERRQEGKNKGKGTKKIEVEGVQNPHAYFEEKDFPELIRGHIEGRNELPNDWQGINLKRIASHIHEAYSNLVTIPINSQDLVKPKARKEKLKSASIGHISQPTVLITEDGVPVVIYCPNVIPFNVQQAVINATGTLSPILDAAMKGKSWRADPALCKDPVTPGSPVGAQTFCYTWKMLGFETKQDEVPEPSTSLYKPMNKAANSDMTETWLKDIKDFVKLVNIFYGVIHPASYKAGINTLVQARTVGSDTTRLWANQWTSVFNAIAVIANRKSGDHLDPKSPEKQYDLLVNLGCNDVKMDMQELGATFQQPSGSILAFSGKLIVHRVDWERANRIAYAFFMRDEIQAHFGAKVKDWPELIVPRST